ncbi:hypothetical protein CON65_12575 [Bacillus pseudomycoides]|uniref:Uncharacterized protein n=1 Tax=Bacillus pseudomycoides TaxID=64104 RepID=A0AA91VC00_9BACI|nr:hypothetical protein CON65_12575 [Bacillus pseudomycoides]
MVEVPGQEKSADEKKLEEKRAKDAARKRAARANKTKTTTRKKPSANDAAQLKVLLLTTSQIMSMRPGMEMWLLTEEEVDNIVIPLNNILAKNDGVGNVMSEYADHIALVIAAFTIFVPKFLMWMKQRNEKRKQEVTHYARPIRNDSTTGQSGGHESGKAQTDHGTNDGQASVSSTGFGGQLATFIPPNATI